MGSPRLMVETLREALEHEQWYYPHPDGHSLDLMNPITKTVHDAARQYLALLESPEQTIAWLREQGAIDIEAAVQAVIRVAGTGLGEDGYAKVWVDQHAEVIAQAVLDAALRVEGEEE